MPSNRAPGWPGGRQADLMPPSWMSCCPKWTGLSCAAQLKPVHFGEHDIQDGGIKSACRPPGQPGARFEGMDQLQLEPLEVGGQWRAQLCVVVNKQDAVHAQFSHRQASAPWAGPRALSTTRNARCRTMSLRRRPWAPECSVSKG